MITLYGIGLSGNVNKVRYCLNALGLEYDWVQTSPMEGENKTEEFLSMSPTGKIPAINIDGFKLFESSTINRYLATANNSSLYPEDPKQRAIVDAWTDYGSIHVQAAMGRVTFNRMMAPMLGKEVDESSLKTGLEFMDRYLPVIDGQLSKTTYLAGDTLSLADINMLAILDSCELVQIDLSPYSNLTKWRDGLKSQDFYQKCYADFGQFVQDFMSAKNA